MKEFWDSRYQAEEYIYGVQPNAFFRDLRINSLYQAEVNLQEGTFHRGKASIIRLLATRLEEVEGKSQKSEGKLEPA